MLSTIREKSKGAFSWLLLLAIGIPFALWGIENYIGGGSEKTVVSVGHKDFFQNDIDHAYTQYSQSFAGMNIDENTLRKQSLDKLIKDEVLLQHVEAKKLIISDNDAKDFIKELDFFKVDGKFDKKQYQAWLNSQHLPALEFVNRIKKTQTMQQFQRAITDSSFATAKDIERFFKIQNQHRDIEYLKVAVLPATTAPTEAEIAEYYKQHQAQYQTTEQMSVDYVTLALDDLAKEVKVTEPQLKAFYEDQKVTYTTKERRKISHILYAFKKGVPEADILKKAQAGLQTLKTKPFNVLATEVSEDPGSAKNGGDLGLLEAGVMVKPFEEAASRLKLNEISAPVKTQYGYHLIKITELTLAEVKPFETVKAEVTKAYQRKEAETNFYALNDKLTEVSYQNPDSLVAVAEALGVTVEKSALFTLASGDGIAKEEAIRKAAFSEEVLKGNNSEPVELGADKIIVLRMAKHNPAMTKPLKEVKSEITEALLAEKAKQQAIKLASDLKKQLLAGKKMADLATENRLKLESVPGLDRSSTKIPFQVSQAVFKAAKPIGGKPTILTVSMPNNEQFVVSLSKITEGVMSENDKKQKQLAEKNLAQALGQATFQAVINSLQANADVAINVAEKP